jgi:hypothetical protein
MKKEYSRIYIDIESLLDIRQAILSELIPEEKIVTYINSEEYNFREIDSFSVDMEAYRNILRESSKILIPRSSITHMIDILETKIANIEKRNVYYGKTTAPEILLNIYPFKLNSKEIAIFENLLFIKLKNKCTITTICDPISKITPFFIKSSNIVAVFIYRFNEWISEHSESFAITKIEDTLFYFPSLYTEKPTIEDMDKIKKQGFSDVFSYLEFFFSNVLSINFLPTIFYTNKVTAGLMLNKYNKTLTKTYLGDYEDGSVKSKV